MTYHPTLAKKRAQILAVYNGMMVSLLKTPSTLTSIKCTQPPPDTVYACSLL